MARASSRPLPLFLAGLLLVLLGGAWTSVEGESYLPRLAVACGALLLVVFVVRHAPEIRFLFLQARSHSEPGPTTTLLLAALVLILGAVVAARSLSFIDLTAERINSLSSATATTLEAVPGTLQMDGFFVEPSAQWDLARRYLELYERSSTRVEVSLVDPDREPARAREAGIARSGVFVIRHEGARTEVHEVSEEAITQGILRVLEGRPRRVGFLRGHGEPSLDAGGDTGITAWAGSMADANFEIREVSLLEEGAVPEDIDALLIIHPRQTLYPPEVAAIRTYLEKGGGIGIWLEPGDSTGLEPFLEFYAVRILPGMLHDNGLVTRRVGRGPWAPALASNPSHAIGVELSGTFVAAPEVRPLEIISPHSADLRILPLLRTDKTATVRAGPSNEDSLLQPAGVREAAVVLEWDVPVGEAWRRTTDELGLPPIKPTARILVAGDASMITNRYLGLGSNAALAINAVHWLTWQVRFLDTQRTFGDPNALKIGRRGLRVLLYVVQFTLPAALVILGVGVWFRRRSRS